MKKNIPRSTFEARREPRMILKFDTGADGFLKMIYVLAGTAVIVLVVGIYFLSRHYHEVTINF